MHGRLRRDQNVSQAKLQTQQVKVLLGFPPLSQKDAQSIGDVSEALLATRYSADAGVHHGELVVEMAEAPEPLFGRP